MTELPTLPYAPRITEFTEPFWDAVEQGILTTTRCNTCGFITFPPKILCPECWGTDLAYIELSGRGILRSYTEVNVAPGVFQAEAPYVIAIVDLEENVRLLSRVRATFEELTPDLPVHMVVRHALPVSLFEFELDAKEEEETERSRNA
jgi:uncharacterized OB-fold protein